jgi:hypothetical protein
MTESEWEEATDVTQVSKAVDTIPCPPPTEPYHDPPVMPSTPRAQHPEVPCCLVCGAGLIWDASIRYYVCDNPACEACE